MQNDPMTREEVWDLLCVHTQTESLRKHALAVEAAMRYYARLFGEDEEHWGRIGLIHDFDYEKYPTAEDHPYRGAEILRALDWPEEDVRCILSHADYTGVPRETPMARTLFAVDELCGFITAVALVRPSRKVAEVEVSSVKKKMKQKAFAAQVRREDIVRGAEVLNLDLETHLGHVLTALQGAADRLGL